MAAQQQINFRVIAYRIPAAQFDEIEAHLSRASWILNCEDIPNWEDLNRACSEICDALENLRWIREKSEGLKLHEQPSLHYPKTQTK